ncbi:MAG: transcriptional regulator, family [Solirubrobacterales bacterium]|nr:transcriptional regulator, family [Solirubrobacterales bacterium]
MSSELPDPALGRRLRTLRKQRGLSLAAAAEQTDVSPSFLSLVERGRSDLALGRLMRLLGLYGASLLDVVPPIDVPDVGVQEPNVIRAGHEVRFTSLGEHIAAYLLVPDAARPLVPMIWVYEPGGAMQVLQANPTDMFSHVLEGSVVYESSGSELVLGPGDTVYVPAGESYRYRNDTGTTARVLGCGYLPDAPVD